MASFNQTDSHSPLALGNDGFPAVEYGGSWCKLYLPFESEIHHSRIWSVPTGDRFSILNLTSEPPAYLDYSSINRDLLNRFDLVLSHNERLVKEFKNAVIFPFGTSWVSGVPNAKEFSLSFLYSTGPKRDLAGYKIRKYIWETRHQINNVNPVFYTSSNSGRVPDVDDCIKYPYQTKDELFKSMFSVVVENESCNNYFTEKIIDCFQTFTIPIYWGCPNLGAYFDVGGVLKFDSPKQFYDNVRLLSAKYYYDNLEFISRNYKLSRDYVNFPSRLRNLIIELVGHS